MPETSDSNLESNSDDLICHCDPEPSLDKPGNGSKINNVPVYSDPEGKNEIFKLTSKEEVVILAEEGDYYNIMASNGEGWVKKILIK